MMNCKQGDLAVVIRADSIFYGYPVQCVKYLGAIKGGTVEDYWEIDRRLGPDHHKIMSDSALRPIRPSEGQDETLTWAPVPEKVTA